MAAKLDVLKMELKYTFLCLLLILPTLSLPTEIKSVKHTKSLYDLKEFKNMCAGYEDEENCVECIEEATLEIPNKKKAAIEIIKKCEELIPEPYRECTPCPNAKACLRRIYRKIQRKKCGMDKDDKEFESGYHATPHFGDDGRTFEIEASGEHWMCKCRQKAHKKSEDGYSFYINARGKLLSCRCKVKIEKPGRYTHPDTFSERLSITESTMHKQKEDLKLDTTHSFSTKVEKEDTATANDVETADTQSPHISEGTSETTQSPRISKRTSENTQSPHSSKGTSENTQNPHSSKGTSEITQSPRISKRTSENTQSPRISKGTSENTQSPDSSEGTSEITQSPSSSEGTSENTQSPHSSKRTSENTQSPPSIEGTSENTQSPHSSKRTSENTQSPPSIEGTSENTQSPPSSEGTSENTQSPHSSKGTSENTQSPHSSKATSEKPQSPHSSKATSEKPQSGTDRSPTKLQDDDYNTKGNEGNIHYDD